jgi:putative intracellular protease/amidase
MIVWSSAKKTTIEAHNTRGGHQRLIEEGYQVDIAAPSAKKLQFVIHDFVDEFDTYTEKLGYTWPADVAFADVCPSQYVALVIPGGRAPEYIRNDPDVQHIVRHFMEGDLPVAQLCRAPLVLAAAGTLQGRRTAAYPALEADVKPLRGIRGRRWGRGRTDGVGSRVAGQSSLDARIHRSAPGEGPSHRIMDVAVVTAA